MDKYSRQEFWHNNISYNNNNVITTISRHIENPNIARTVYSAIFRHTEGYSDIIEVYVDSRNPCMKTLPYLELEASSKACQTFKMTMHIQTYGIVRKGYSSILKDL